MTIGELLDTRGERCTARCGCIGWASGNPRATRGTRATWGKRLFIRCESCRKIKEYER